MCQQCLDHKPVLIFEQKLYEYAYISYHEKKNHPFCHFCYNKSFYDRDALTKHYATDHHFCDMCKKLGRKRMERGKHINLPEYEVYRDFNELRKH